MASLVNVHISKNCINNILIMSLMIFKKIYLHFQEVKYLHSRLNIDMEILINLYVEEKIKTVVIDNLINYNRK